MTIQKIKNSLVKFLRMICFIKLSQDISYLMPAVKTCCVRLTFTSTCASVCLLANVWDLSPLKKWKQVTCVQHSKFGTIIFLFILIPDSR